MQGPEFAGLAAAAATFGGVWFGHVAVRRIEFAAARLGPFMLAFLLAGLALEAAVLLSASFALSAFLGILGATFLFDAPELKRQEKRVNAGRARANPRNPRHHLALASGRAVLEDPLGGEPPVPVYAGRSK